MQKVTAAVIWRNGAVLIAKRKTRGSLGAAWEFPGGKLEPGETPEECLRRELKEELGLDARIGRFIGGFPFHSASLSIELLAYQASIQEGGFVLTDHDEVRWVRPEELPSFNFTRADFPLVRVLIENAEDL
jgi:8-oxo-dGTP diphosphatase